VVGVSKDSMKSHQGFASKLELRFPLLSDPEGTVIGAYGAWKSEPGGGVDRSTFLIDPEGLVRRIWRHVKVEGHAEAVLAALDELT
jgi:peroxiredoxin Q/BCP